MLLSDHFFLCELKTVSPSSDPVVIRELCMPLHRAVTQVVERWHHPVKRKKVKEFLTWHHALLLFLFPASPCCPVAGRQGPWA